MVKTQEHLESIIKDIKMVNSSVFSMKWWFEVTANDSRNNPGWFIKAKFERPDTETGIMGIGAGRPEFVPEGTSESGIVKTCWLCIELLVRHETMESYRYKGARIFNPHHDVKELASLETQHATTRNGGYIT